MAVSPARNGSLLPRRAARRGTVMRGLDMWFRMGYASHSSLKDAKALLDE